MVLKLTVLFNNLFLINKIKKFIFIEMRKFTLECTGFVVAECRSKIYIFSYLFVLKTNESKCL